MKKYAIIVAAGSGTRMESSIPKQFLLLRGKPLIWYSIKAFLDAFQDVEIILVLPERHVEISEIINEFILDTGRISIVTGGQERFDSVRNGLDLVREKSIVFVHDGVRCLVTKELIMRCYEEALKSGSAIPVVDSKDSVRMILDNGSGSRVLSRDQVKRIQTPQTFSSELIIPAYRAPYHEKFTDEATVLEAFGIEPTLIPGDERNIKITTPLDLLVAEKIMESIKD